MIDSSLEENKYGEGEGSPFSTLISKIIEGLKWSCKDAAKSRAENPESEHSLKPKNEIVSKLYEAVHLLLREGERWKENLCKEHTKKQMVFLKAELLLLNCSILSTFMQMISIAKLTAE